MHLRIASLGVLLAAGISLPAMAADQPVHLKLSTWIPPSHPLTASIQDWIDSISKASGGTITGTIYPAEQLGKAFDHYDMTRDGITDLAYVSPGYQPGRFPVINAGQLPFTFTDATSGTAALDEWYRKYSPREMKDVKVCLAFIHDPGSLHSRRRIVTPDDMKGVKVRPAQGTVGELVTSLGGANVKASAPESRDMLERGVADAITFPWNSLFLFGIDKVVKYHLDVPLYSTSYVWTMNKDRYDSMTAAQKKVMDEHCTTEWAARFGSRWGDYEAAGRVRMKTEPGHEVIALTTEQREQWRKAAEPLRKNWSDSVRKVGVDPDAALAELASAIARHGGR